MGRWKVEGARWQEEGGRWKVEGGRWKAEGGRCKEFGKLRVVDVAGWKEGDGLMGQHVNTHI